MRISLFDGVAQGVLIEKVGLQQFDLILEGLNSLKIDGRTPADKTEDLVAFS